MWIKSAVLLAIVLASVTTYGDPIYKWTDENGQVHYDNAISKSQKKVADKVKFGSVSTSVSQHLETETRHASEKGQPGNNSKQIESTDSKVAASDSTQASDGSTATNNKKNRCEEEWKKYRESEACFAPYVTVHGIKGEAFEHCTQVTQPALCN